jgi:hypothetical protein
MINAREVIDYLLYYLEIITVIIVFPLYSALEVLSEFFKIEILEIQPSFTLVLVFGILFLASLLHLLLGKVPRNAYAVPLYTSSEIKEYMERMVDHVQMELLTTHINAQPFPPEKDLILKMARKKATQKKKITGTRIVGISNKEDQQIALNTLELKNLPYVDVELKIIDLSGQTTTTKTPNVIIKDKNEALLTFPAIEKGKSKGIFFRDEAIVHEIIVEYWQNMKVISHEGREETIEKMRF